MPDNDQATPRTLLAFDFGLRRVGVALGFPQTETATPLQTIAWQSYDELWSRIAPLIQEWRPQRLLVGMPNLHSGEKHDLEKPIRRFAAQLEKRFDIATAFVDESYSSRDAEARLREIRRSGRKKKIDKTEIDRLAAALLIEQWMESRPPVSG